MKKKWKNRKTKNIVKVKEKQILTEVERGWIEGEGE